MAKPPALKNEEASIERPLCAVDGQTRSSLVASRTWVRWDMSMSSGALAPPILVETHPVPANLISPWKTNLANLSMVDSPTTSTASL
jgi:hypothetical protein